MGTSSPYNTKAEVAFLGVGCVGGTDSYKEFQKRLYGAFISLAYLGFLFQSWYWNENERSYKNLPQNYIVSALKNR